MSYLRPMSVLYESPSSEMCIERAHPKTTWSHSWIIIDKNYLLEVITPISRSRFPPNPGFEIW